jgi:ubiquinol-cytochrome c reductase cytochrome b subunit
MLRVFFTGAFRKPREIGWFISCCSGAGHGGGIHGYSLPDDLLSGAVCKSCAGIIRAFRQSDLDLLTCYSVGFPGTTLVAMFYSIPSCCCRPSWSRPSVHLCVIVEANTPVRWPGHQR